MKSEVTTPIDGVKLRNRYCLLRHGKSVANERNLIVSMAPIGLLEFGLTPEGAQQVRDALTAGEPLLAEITQIHSSDFRRARETAEIAAEMLKRTIAYKPQLRERRFGDFEGRSTQNYPLVWEADEEDASHTGWNVESVEAVALRMSEVVLELERSGEGETHLLVSHGDPLQILITAANRTDLRLHRRIDPIATAEWRFLASSR